MKRKKRKRSHDGSRLVGKSTACKKSCWEMQTMNLNLRKSFSNPKALKKKKRGKKNNGKINYVSCIER